MAFDIFGRDEQKVNVQEVKSLSKDNKAMTKTKPLHFITSSNGTGAEIER